MPVVHTAVSAGQQERQGFDRQLRYIELLGVGDDGVGFAAILNNALERQ